MEAKKPKQQQKSKSKTSRNKNLEFSVITYIFLLLFICLMGYFVYFQVVKSEKFINSPYNSLQDLFSKNVVRGEIRSDDGYVLAKTDVAADSCGTDDGAGGGRDTGAENHAFQAGQCPE